MIVIGDKSFQNCLSTFKLFSDKHKFSYAKPSSYVSELN